MLLLINLLLIIYCSKQSFFQLIRVNPCVTQFQYLPVFTQLLPAQFLEQYLNHSTILKNHSTITGHIKLDPILMDKAIAHYLLHEVDLFMGPLVSTAPLIETQHLYIDKASRIQINLVVVFIFSRYWFKSILLDQCFTYSFFGSIQFNVINVCLTIDLTQRLLNSLCV